MKLSRKRSFKFVHSSDEIKTIFPLNKRKFTYDAQYYRPYMTNNKLTQMDIHSFFKEISLSSNNFFYLRLWNSLAIFLSLIPALIIIVLFAGFFYLDNLSDYFAIHFQTPSSMIFAGILVTLLFIIAASIARIYTYDKTRSAIEKIIQARSDYYTNKRLRWELPKKSIDSIILYNLDISLDSSFEIEIYGNENSKDFISPDLQKTLLDIPSASDLSR